MSVESISSFEPHEEPWPVGYDGLEGSDQIVEWPFDDTRNVDDALENDASLRDGHYEAPLAHLGETAATVPYYIRQPQHLESVSTGQDDDPKPAVFVVGGFGNGVAAIENAVDSIAEYGYLAIGSGQNRTELQDVASATDIRALNNLDVIEAQGLQHSRVDLAPHSQGMLTAVAMVRLAQERGWTCFDKANIMAIAPAGTDPVESSASLIRRNIASSIHDMRTSAEQTGGHDERVKRTLEEHWTNTTTNLSRTRQEVRELSHGMQEQDWRDLMARTTGKVVIHALANDKSFAYAQLDRGAATAMKALAGTEAENRFSYVSIVPGATGIGPNGVTRETASHAYPLYQAEQVVSAVIANARSSEQNIATLPMNGLEGDITDAELQAYTRQWKLEKAEFDEQVAAAVAAERARQQDWRISYSLGHMATAASGALARLR